MIQTIDRINGGKQVLISGTNIPVTVLNIADESNTIIAGSPKKYTIEQDKQLSEKIADNSTILAVKNSDSDLIIFTEEQLFEIDLSSGKSSAIHMHNVHAAISKSHAVTIDHLRKLSIYNCNQNQNENKNSLRNF